MVKTTMMAELEAVAKLPKEEQRFLYELDSLASYQSTVDSWKAKMNADPAYAFEWADDAMAAAAYVWVATQVRLLLSDKGYAAAKQVCVEEALSGAASPSHSTSTCTNTMRAYKTAGFARLARR
jgi:hypothetical protein